MQVSTKSPRTSSIYQIVPNSAKSYWHHRRRHIYFVMLFVCLVCLLHIVVIVIGHKNVIHCSINSVSECDSACFLMSALVNTLVCFDAMTWLLVLYNLEKRFTRLNEQLNSIVSSFTYSSTVFVMCLHDLHGVLLFCLDSETNVPCQRYTVHRPYSPNYKTNSFLLCCDKVSFLLLNPK